MNLLRNELRKVIPYRTFWTVITIYVLLLVLLVYASSSFVINGKALGTPTYQFPEIWNRLTYIASFFNLLLGILIIVLVTDEFSFRTIRQQVIDGLSRFDIVAAKFYLILCIAACSSLFLLAIGLFFGLRYSSDVSFNAIFGQINHVFYFFVQAVAYMTLAMVFGVLIRKSGLAIIAFIAYSKIIEPIIHYNTADALDKYFPMKAITSLTPMPGQELFDQFTTQTLMLSSAWATLLVLIYVFLFLVIAHLVLKYQDL
jgi:ABC-2 type transport system permease protein